MSRITRYIFRPRFSPVEVLLLVGAAAAADRKEYLIAAFIVFAAMSASWIWRELTREQEG